MSLNIGRAGKVFGLIEIGGYGTVQAPAASNALRHIDFKPSWDPFNRVESEEKKVSPGKVTLFDRRPTAALSSLVSLLRPSGTLNTLPEAGFLFEAAFGSKTNVTLAATCTPKTPTCALLPAEAGLVTSGAHSYKVVFVTAGALHSKPSAASAPITTATGATGKVTVTVPVGPATCTDREIYRTEANADPAIAANFKLVAAVGNNSAVTYVDNIADASLTTVCPTTDTSTLLSTTGGFVSDASTLAVGDAVVITRNSKNYVRFLTAVSTTNLTWAPALPSAVIAGEAVKGCVTYKLATANAVAVALFHYLAGYKRELRGVGIDKLAMEFDANVEARFTASGPAQKMLTDAACVAEPGAFTTVGGNPPSGLVGECLIGDVAYLVKKSSVDLTNGLKVRNDEYGAAAENGLASELYRDGRRAVEISLDAFVETAATLHDLAIAGTAASFFKQTGRTEGNIVAVYAPKVDWKVPDTSTGDGAADWAFKGTALETADNQNNELTLAFA